MRIFIKKKVFINRETGETGEYTALCVESDGIVTEMSVKNANQKFTEAFEDLGVTPRTLKKLKPNEEITITSEE